MLRFLPNQIVAFEVLAWGSRIAFKTDFQDNRYFNHDWYCVLFVDSQRLCLLLSNFSYIIIKNCLARWWQLV